MEDGKSAGIGLSGKKSGTGTGSRLGTAHQPNTTFRCPTFLFSGMSAFAAAHETLDRKAVSADFNPLTEPRTHPQ